MITKQTKAELAELTEKADTIIDYLIQKDLLIILCREVDKYQGRETLVYPLNISTKEMNNGLFTCLNLRSRFNPELSYYVVSKEDWEERPEFIKNRILNEDKYLEFEDAIGGGSVLTACGIIKI